MSMSLNKKEKRNKIMSKKIKMITSIIVVVAILVSFFHSLKVKSKHIEEFLNSPDEEDVVVDKKDINIDIE